jgi:hypothetical protein
MRCFLDPRSKFSGHSDRAKGRQADFGTTLEFQVRVDRASRRIAASAERIYRALTDRDAVQQWLPPRGARGIMEEFEPRAGGASKMTPVLDMEGETGSRKASRNTNSIDGRFVELIPNKLVQQIFKFRSEDLRRRNDDEMDTHTHVRKNGCRNLGRECSGWD